MTPTEDQAAIARYRESMCRAWGKGDTNEWPIKLNSAMHLFLKEFGEEYIDDLTWLEARGHSLAGIAEDFYSPARFYRVIDAVVYGMRRNRYPVTRQREIILKLLQMTKALKHGSEFNEDGRNIVWSPEQVRAASAKLERPVADLAESQCVHRLCAALWAYTEAICFGAHDITKEFHGPYRHSSTSDGLLVKEFLNLRPDCLWPDIPLLPCHKVVVYQRYASSVSLAIDSHGHVSHGGASLVGSLSSWAIEIDGVPQDLPAAREYLPQIHAAVTAISKRIATMSWHDKVLKYADVFWFRKKPLCDRRGRPWQVPADVRRQIEQGAENARWKRRLPDDACERLAMVTI